MKPVRDVLYLLPPTAQNAVRGELTELGGQEGTGAQSDDWVVVQTESHTIRLLLCFSLDAALDALQDHYFNFVCVDTRYREAPEDEDQPPLYRHFIEKIHYSGDPDQRYPLSRIIAILADDQTVADHAFELGKLRVGGFVVGLGAQLFAQMDRLYDPDPGKSALCLAGGGVEGFLFELGVLMALNAHLQGKSVTDLDIYCGISAGSMVAAMIANKVEPEDMAEAMSSPRGSAEIEGLTSSMIYDPHYREYFSRLWNLGKTLPLKGWSQMVSSLIKTVPTGFFQGDALRDFMHKQLTQGSRTDDFRELQNELYIGATEQDNSTHVVFGDGQWRDVPISTAVRASIALTPFFSPAKIRGRYFVDGQYTRTANFHVAVERGAKLVIIIDPLVPIRVEMPGYVQSKGGVFGGLQALKAVIHTRFMHGFQAAVDAYPEVDFILFKPEGDEMRIMSGSPMKYNIRTEILNVAYRYAVKKIQRNFDVLQASFARHGYRLQREPRLRRPHRQVF